jgi:hypothetical protein
LQGSRILVLSLQCDLLQVVTHPTEPRAVFSSICCFDRKLLASCSYMEYVDVGAGAARLVRQKCFMLALQGL